jgi:hypothetical protein
LWKQAALHDSSDVDIYLEELTEVVELPPRDTLAAGASPSMRSAKRCDCDCRCHYFCQHRTEWNDVTRDRDSKYDLTPFGRREYESALPSCSASTVPL